MTALTHRPALSLNLWKTPILGRLTYAFWKMNAARKVRWMKNWVSYIGSHVEIGSGAGSVLDVMRGMNYDIDGLDVRDIGYRDDLRPIVYDGEKMPFCKHAYDTALLPSILHHTEDPEQLIQEAMRVAKRVVIIETVHEGRFTQWPAKAFDSFMNPSFKGHPYSQRTISEWQDTFNQLGLAVEHTSVHRVAGVFKQAVFVLEPHSEGSVCLAQNAA